MITLFSDLPSPAVTTVFYIIFPLSLGLSPIASPSYTRKRPLCLYLQPLLSLTIYPGRGATVHLYDDPARQRPPLVCASLPCQPSQSSSLREPVHALPVRSPPFAILKLRPGPCQPQGFPVRGSLHPSTCFHQPHPPPPPLPASTSGPIICRFIVA